MAVLQNKFFIPELKGLLKKDDGKDHSSIPLLTGQVFKALYVRVYVDMIVQA